MSLIAQHPKAETEKERLLTLASLPELTLRLMAKEKTRGAEIAWLRTFLDGGYLDIDLPIDIDDSAYVQRTGNWVMRARSFTRFIASGHLSTKQSAELFGSEYGDHAIGFLEPTAETSAFFQSACDRFLASARTAIAHPRHDRIGKSKYGFDTVFTCWIMLAIAIDSPEHVRQLVDLNPNGVDQRLQPDELGEVYMHPVYGVNEESVSVMQYAFQLSRLGCMQALLDTGGDAVITMGDRISEKGSRLLSDFNFVDNFKHRYFPLRCTPEAFAFMVKACVQHRYLHDKVAKYAPHAIERPEGPRASYDPYLDALFDTKILDGRGADVARMACRAGNLNALSRAKKLAWHTLGKAGDCLDNPIYLALCHYEPTVESDHLAAIEEIVQRAKNEGKLDQLLVWKTHFNRGLHGPEPLATAIRKNAPDVIIHYLEAGFDPFAPIGKDQGSTIEFALKLNTEVGRDMAILMQGWRTREAAMNVLRLL